MKLLSLRKGIILSAGLLLMLFSSCENQMVPDFEEPGVEDTAGALVFDDAARGISVYVSPEGEDIPIRTEEESGEVSSVELIDYVLFEETASSFRSFGGVNLCCNALVLGRRSDGAPGLWMVSRDGRVRPVVNSEGLETSELLGIAEDRQPISKYYGWTYEALEMIQNGDEIIIIGYVENKDGVSLHHFEIEPGTTVGVYWSVMKDEEGYFHISRARVIGLRDQTRWSGYVRSIDRGYHYRHRWMRMLRLFFAGWYDVYLTMPSGIDLGENDGEYHIYGTDQDGGSALAVITSRKVLSIEEYTITDNEPPEAVFPEGDYRVIGSGDLPMYGLYAEAGTINDRPFFTETENGTYHMFHAYLTNSNPRPAPGNFWILDTDTSITELTEADYAYRSTELLPPEGTWAQLTGTDEAPEVKRIPISGDLEVDGFLTVEYLYSDQDNDAEGDTRFQWLRCDDPDSDGVEIGGATSQTYSITTEDAGSYLKVRIIPVDVRGAEGDSLTSDAIGRISGS